MLNKILIFLFARHASQDYTTKNATGGFRSENGSSSSFLPAIDAEVTFKNFSCIKPCHVIHIMIYTVIHNKTDV